MLKRLRAMAGWVIILCAPGFAACYSYIPIGDGAAPRGAVVRTRVDGVPTLQVGDRIMHDVTRIDGEVIRWEPDSLSLSALQVRAFGEEHPGQGYTVQLALGDVTSVSLKQLNKRRTILLALGAVAAAFLGQHALSSGVRGNDNPPGGGPVK